MQKKTIVSLGALALFVLATAQPVNADPDVTPGNVTAIGFNFTPNVQKAVYDNVTFHNEDTDIGATHRPHADDLCFDTGNIAPGDHAVADVSGCGAVTTYHCHIHPFMVGVIVK